MAQTSSPYGFQRVKGKYPSDTCGPLSTQYIQSGFAVAGQASNTNGNLGSGDPVVYGAVSNGAGIFTYIGTLDAAADYNTSPVATEQPILGIIDSFEYQPAVSTIPLQRTGIWISGTTTQNALQAQVTILDLPYTVFQVQTNTSIVGLGTIGFVNYATNPNFIIGQNFGFTYNGGATASNQSSVAQLYITGGTMLQGATSATSCFLPFKVIDIAPIYGNSWTDPYVDLLVMVNNHYLKPGSASVSG